MDCVSPEQCDVELQQLEEVWKSKQMYARSSSEINFHSWFTKYQALNIKEKMLKPLCQVEGLGHTPEIILTNPPTHVLRKRLTIKV